MIAEKELLLALLVEKYTCKTLTIPQTAQPIRRKKHQRNTRGKIHYWTNADKQHLVQKRSEGHSFELIAGVMGLRLSQVKNMYYKLTVRDVVAKQGDS